MAFIGFVNNGGNLVFLLVACTAYFIAVEAVKCHICAWSPAENRTDYCSEANFDVNMIKSVHACKMGCEYVSVVDRNGVVVSYYRNCANANARVELTCKRTPGKEVTRLACTCNSDLCNGLPSAASALPIMSVGIGIIVGALLLPLTASLMTPI